MFKHESKDAKRAGLGDQERAREGADINASFPALCRVSENNPENLIWVDIYSTIQREEPRWVKRIGSYKRTPFDISVEGNKLPPYEFTGAWFVDITT